MSTSFITPQDDLLKSILAFCKQNEVTETSFGKKAIGDPNLVRDMRAGRELRSSTVRKVMTAINTSVAK